MKSCKRKEREKREYVYQRLGRNLSLGLSDWQASVLTTTTSHIHPFRHEN
jgi:23S rRNA G2445 N2-methylase RlmL